MLTNFSRTLAFVLYSRSKEPIRSEMRFLIASHSYLSLLSCCFIFLDPKFPMCAKKKSTKHEIHHLRICGNFSKSSMKSSKSTTSLFVYFYLICDVFATNFKLQYPSDFIALGWLVCAELCICGL